MKQRLIKVTSKRFWWFHKLFKTKTYTLCKIMDVIVNGEAQRELIAQRTKQFVLRMILTGEDGYFDTDQTVETLH